MADTYCTRLKSRQPQFQLPHRLRLAPAPPVRAVSARPVVLSVGDKKKVGSGTAQLGATASINWAESPRVMPIIDIRRFSLPTTCWLFVFPVTSSGTCVIYFVQRSQGPPPQRGDRLKHVELSLAVIRCARIPISGHLNRGRGRGRGSCQGREAEAAVTGDNPEFAGSSRRDAPSRLVGYMCGLRSTGLWVPLGIFGL
jgi:hypothetical protein